MLKRFRAASMGRAGSIHKHTSHITVELDIPKSAASASVEGKAVEKAKAQKTKSPAAAKKEVSAKGEKEAAHKDKKTKAHKK
jgi:hypothetical protein